MTSLDQISITAPDDWHIHLRDGDALATTVAHAAQAVRRAIIMPNLVPPVMNAEQALGYRERIMANCPEGADFEPLMVLYLTDRTDATIIKEAAAAGVVACKLYPAGATTNSDSGVTDITKLDEAIEAMQAVGMKLLVHGEVTHSDVDIFDREAVFIDKILRPLVTRFPELKLVMEHITTSAAVDFVRGCGDNVAATITAHHLLFNRNDMLVGGIRPHLYCLPILKAMDHQKALLEAATSGDPKFFLGTDSAPHPKNKKEAACGCAGSYTAYAPLALYAESFDQAGKLDMLEGFASHFGPDFYSLPRNTGKITLQRRQWTVPSHYPLGDSTVVPLLAGETLNWQVLES